MMFRNAARCLAVCVATIIVLSACMDGSRVVPVTDRSLYPGQTSGNHYVVQPGDTLYSIARRYGEDHRTLAVRNGIKPPFEIRVGQRLALGARGMASARNAPSASSSPVAGGDVGPGAEVFALPGVAAEAPRPVALDAPMTETAVAPAAEPAKPLAATPASLPRKEAEPVQDAPLSRKVAEPAQAAPRKGKWMWPARGKVARSSPAANGLDIVGERGQAIVAAAPGRIVYGGSGLRGYGKLIIIKHNDEFLSAYAHNDRLLVQEGQRVQQGQKIAEMGMSGTDRVKLHFQIRRNGAPVDPLKFLPARR
jgi:lipoprotein NlpD